MIEVYRDTLAPELGLHQLRYLRIFPRQYAIRVCHQSDTAAQSCKRLRQFTTDRACAHYKQALRQLPDLPHGIGRKVIERSKTGNIRYPRAGTSGNHNMCAQSASAR